MILADFVEPTCIKLVDKKYCQSTCSKNVDNLQRTNKLCCERIIIALENWGGGGILIHKFIFTDHFKRIVQNITR